MSEKHRRIKTTSTCKHCSTEFYPCADSYGIYCSTKCQKLFDYALRLSKVRSTGNWFGGWRSPSAIRRALIAESPNECSICKTSEWMGQPISLVMDHVNGNSDDWSCTNIRLVCGNCDMQLPTYKNKNAGNGRHSRRERYKQGKSF